MLSESTGIAAYGKGLHSAFFRRVEQVAGSQGIAIDIVKSTAGRRLGTAFFEAANGLFDFRQNLTRLHDLFHQCVVRIQGPVFVQMVDMSADDFLCLPDPGAWKKFTEIES
ncbi:MAG TPA: hypothetical protein VI758_03510, partial [Bacteroidota bacterium]